MPSRPTHSPRPAPLMLRSSPSSRVGVGNFKRSLPGEFHAIGDNLSLYKSILQESLRKMVNPAQRRTWVRWVQDAFAVSERAACDAGGVARSSVRYQSVAAPQEPLRRRLRELAASRVAYGYRRLHVLLRREGWPVNRKRIQRLYRDEGLTQPR